MAVILLSLAVYAFFQIRFYIRHQNKKEIAIFLVLFFVSIFYLYGYLKKIELKNLSDLLNAVYDPIADLIFDIP